MTPNATHPKADKNGWIKFSDAKPDGRSAIIVSDKEGEFINLCYGPICDGIYTHWKPFDIPLPPSEKTQREIDDEAYQEWASKTLHYDATVCGILADQKWHAALAWERSRKKTE
jgi:hypothetical protein